MSAYEACIDPPSDVWDQFVMAHARAHFLQLSTWGRFKSRFGWDDQRVGLLDESGRLLAGAQILYRRLPLGLGRLAYVPFGPLVDWHDTAQTQALFALIDRVARQRGTVFLKLEPGYEVPLEHLQAQRFRPSPQTVQPPRTLILDIGGHDGAGNPIDEAAVLKQMNQSTRRNIRKSEKFGVHVRIGDQQDMGSFNHLLHETAERQEFGVHTPEYYEYIRENIIASDQPPQGALLIASFVDEDTGQRHDLSGVIVFACAKQSWYLYGASNDLERHRMASFAVQWAAIQWARAQGALTYDMYGVPDCSLEELERRFAERSDGLWSIYRFKRGWGGRVVRTVGAWDRVYNPLLYWGYRLYLRWRREMPG
ncbi:MAG: aminoacyltransferase [Chloroflexi bacterium]|nr:aminoacyltransferase [Chloroflexota bacterium]